MNLIDEEFVQPKKTDKSKKTTKILLISIIILVIFIVIIICMIVALKQEPLTVVLDGNVNSNIKSLLLIEDGKVSIPIKEIAPLLGYEGFNGDYINKSEDTDKCYIESAEEVVNFVANSNKIEKINPQTKESSYIQIDEPVKLNSGKLYITPQGLAKAFNVYYNFKEDKNRIVIETMQYILNSYEQDAIEIGYKGVSKKYNDAKAALIDLVITIDSKGKYGIYNMATESEVLEAKYDNILFIPNSNEFLVTSNGKMGIKGIDGKDKIKMQYEDINIISESDKLYVVKKDNRYGVINAIDEVVIPIIFDKIGVDITQFENNDLKNSYVIFDELVPVMRDDKWGLYNINGEQLCKNIYDGFGCLVSNSKNARSTLIIPNYDLLIARKDKKFYLLDKDAKEARNGIDFDAIYMEIEAGKKTYYVTRNKTTVDIENIIEQLIDTSNSKINSNNDNQDEEEMQDDEKNTNEKDNESSDDNENNNDKSNGEENNDSQNGEENNASHNEEEINNESSNQDE